MPVCDPVMLLGAGQLKACQNFAQSDGTGYHNILAFELPVSQGGAPGRQIRDKFANPNATIPNGTAIPAGKIVTLDKVHIWTSLAYTLDPNTCVITECRDALEFAPLWRVRINGASPDYLEDNLPSSGLLVGSHPPWVANQVPQSALFGHIVARSLQATFFPRSFDFFIPCDIVLIPDDVFNIQMALPVDNVALEYDVWATGHIEDVPPA